MYEYEYMNNLDYVQVIGEASILLQSCFLENEPDVSMNFTLIYTKLRPNYNTVALIGFMNFWCLKNTGHNLMLKIELVTCD
jgi:hypothetical protein